MARCTLPSRQSLGLWEKSHPAGCRLPIADCRLLTTDWLLRAFMAGFASSLTLS
jgi:hypothetical protein